MCVHATRFPRAVVLLLAVSFLSIFAAGASARDAWRSDAQAIARLYSAAFDRYPDGPGLNFWVRSWEDGNSPLVIAEQFYQSPEFRGNYGPLSDRQFVEQLYINVLGRPGESGGVDFWLTKLTSGESRAGVLLGFSDSSENVSKTEQAFSLIAKAGDYPDSGGPPGGSWIFQSGDRRDSDFYSDPVQVSATLQFNAIAAGYYHSCAVDTSGQTYCWGHNKYGQLGTHSPGTDCGTIACSGTPVPVAGGHGFTQLVAGRRHSCGLTGSGAAWCWGYGQNGQLGDGLGTDSPVPVQVAGGLTFTTLAANATSESTCGLTASGEAWCWGRNGAGSLGNGMDHSAAHVPAQVMTSLRFVSISISESTACGVSTEGDAYCWGDNRYGQLGIGSAGTDGGFAGSNSPVAVQGGEKFIQVVTDGLHSCALQQSGAMFCWGLRAWMSSVAFNSSRHDNIYDSLPTRAGGSGNPWYDGYLTPDPGAPWVGTTGSPWTAAAVGHGQTCALAASGALDCWGQLWGDPLAWGPNIAPYPVRMGGDRAFIAFASGGGHDCGISADGFVYCWGSNNWGQTGRAPQLSW